MTMTETEPRKACGHVMVGFKFLQTGLRSVMASEPLGRFESSFSPSTRSTKTSMTLSLRTLLAAILNFVLCCLIGLA